MFFLKTSIVLLCMLLLLVNVEAKECGRNFSEFETVDAEGFCLSYLHRPASQETVQPLTNGSEVRPGDQYRIVFIPERDCFVYIFQVDLEDRIDQLFPAIVDIEETSLTISNPVQGANIYRVPTEAQFYNTVPDTGLKYIYFLASQQADEELEEHFRRMSVARVRRDIARETVFRKRFLETIQQRKPASHIEPIAHQELKKRLPTDRIKGVANEIIQVLIGVGFRGLSSKGITKNIEDELDKMPKSIAFNIFEEYSTSIIPESYPLLYEYGKALQGLKNAVLVIAAHTDDGKDESYSLNLSERRAKVVKQFLITNFRIEEESLKIKPFGQSKPMFSNETPEGRRLNNRIEFIRIQ